jgi:hypothetical protein
MMNRANEIYVNVLDAMQDAEELDGVDGDHYVFLMSSIAIEATKRMNNCIDNMAWTAEKFEPTVEEAV